ncbi:MAG: ATP-binding protein [Halieaceae bacterium]
MNLFAKIFLGFWLSTAAIIGSWLLANEYVDPLGDMLTQDAGQQSRMQPMPPRPVRPGGRPPGGPGGGADFGLAPRSMFRIYYGLQNVAENDLRSWISRQEEAEKLQIRLVDSDGREIFGRKLVPGSTQILKRLQGFRRRAAHQERGMLLFGQELYRPEWGSVSMIISTRAPASPIVKFLTDHLWLRLLLALLISGAISYAVSRYLTRPLKHLQQASRDLAEGNLAARIAVSAKGGDETNELARDFNSMAEQLQEKIQAQKRLLNDVSHELRSPLARMRVALALAEKEPARSVEQLQRIELETERLDGLIGQLLSLPDAQADMEDSIDLVSLLQQLCEDANFEAQAQNKQVGFHSELDEAVVRSHGDLLKKALENVIRNAIHYTGIATRVSVTLEQQNSALQIMVEDHGPGVPEDDLEKIFTPFYRIDEARQRETGGFGLGLSITRRAIEQHGGSAHAENFDQGLRVIITLPA